MSTDPVTSRCLLPLPGNVCYMDCGLKPVKDSEERHSSEPTDLYDCIFRVKACVDRDHATASRLPRTMEPEGEDETGAESSVSITHVLPRRLGEVVMDRCFVPCNPSTTQHKTLGPIEAPPFYCIHPSIFCGKFYVPSPCPLPALVANNV